jgi:N-glycosylase/DNA lyase
MANKLNKLYERVMREGKNKLSLEETWEYLNKTYNKSELINLVLKYSKDIKNTNFRKILTKKPKDDIYVFLARRITVYEDNGKYTIK